MSHQPLGPWPNGPQPALSIRTQGKAIPPEKLPKAVRLYGRYRLEEGLAERESSSAGPFLGVPDRSPSAASHPSTRARSTSGSTYGAGESVVSFGNESPSSAAVRTTFDGRQVKEPRKRSKLSPKAKAKAALIRHLGACFDCRNRRVPCQFEHHDISAIHREWLGRSTPTQLAVQPALFRPHSQSAPQPMEDSNLTPSHPPRHFSAGQIPSTYNVPQYEILGLDRTVDQLQRFPGLPPQDPQSPGNTDFFSEDLPSTDYDFALLDQLGLSANPPSYQNSSMFLIGIHRENMWRCQFDSGLCPFAFVDQDALERHFESVHFPFTRLDPAYRFVCSACQTIRDFINEACPSCLGQASVELRLYGNRIPTASFPRVSPDGPDPFVADASSSTPLFAWTANDAQQMGPNLGHGNNMFQGGMNQGGYPYQNNNMYRNNGPGGQSTQPSTPQSGGYQYQGNNLNGSPVANPLTIRYWHTKAVQTFRDHRFLLLAVVLLFALTLIIETRNWLITKTRTFHPQPNLPSIGFAGVWLSFAICHTYWSTSKKPPFGAGARSKNAQCLFNDLTAFSSQCRQTAPTTCIRSEILL